MATQILHVRNVPEELYRQVRKLAASERRSLSAQVILLLEHAVSKTSLEPPALSGILDRLRARRESIRLPKNWPGAVGLLRQDRSR